VAWIVERTISTPATHFAHHAESEDDGIGHYHGNYCNLMFLWDVIFRTGLITRKYPPRVGVIEERLQGATPWYVQLFHPLVSARRRAVQETLVMESPRVGEECRVLLPSMPPTKQLMSRVSQI
jgi:hypothetical protein